MNLHKEGMDYILGLESDRQTDEHVSALLVAANALARARRASNGADAHLRKGVLDGITRELAKVRRRAA